MKAQAYYLQGAHDFKLITVDKNKYAIARAAKYAMSDSWQAKAYAKGLNDVGYEYRQGLSVFGPLKAMNDAVWCVTGVDAFKLCRESDSKVIRMVQGYKDTLVAEQIAECKAAREAQQAKPKALSFRVYVALPFIGTARSFDIEAHDVWLADEAARVYLSANESIAKVIQI